MSFVYNWKVSNGDKVVVEYCFSSVDKCIKVVEMSVNGKYHRTSWMSEAGRAGTGSARASESTGRQSYRFQPS